MWCMQRTNIYLDQAQVEALDGIAGKDGVSRAQVVRRLIDRGLAGAGQDTDALVNAIFSAGGTCKDVELSGRGSSQRQEYLDQLWAK